VPNTGFKEEFMKHFKTLGLAAVAAMAFMAFIGVSSAAAGSTALCAANQTPCTSPLGATTIKAHLVPGTHATLTGNVNVTCSVSTVEGKTNGGTASPLTGEITGLTFSGPCTGCTKVTAVNLNYSASATHTGAGKGTFTVKAGKNGNPGATLEGCPFGVHCTASTTSIVLDIVNTATGTPRIKAVNEPLNMSGFGCGTTATWNAEYEVTSPHPVYISS
jgi:hypothetical protein